MQGTTFPSIRYRCLRSIVGSLAVGLTASSAIAAEPSKEPQCHAVGGTVMTDFISDTTTLGTATGDLRGGVSATLVDQAPEGDAVVFFVQHHWVTDAGDVILSDVARATAKPVGPGLFAIVSYPVKITGGTGRFAGATGRLDNIGELDATTGRTIFRYHGDVCLAGPSK